MTDKAVTIELPSEVVRRAVSALYEAGGSFRCAGNEVDARYIDREGVKLATAYNEAMDATRAAKEAS